MGFERIHRSPTAAPASRSKSRRVPARSASDADARLIERSLATIDARQWAAPADTRIRRKAGPAGRSGGRWVRSHERLTRAPQPSDPTPSGDDQVIRRVWVPANAGTITESSKREKAAHRLAVSMMTHIGSVGDTIIQITEDGTVVRGKRNLQAYRVDYQGNTTEEDWMNIQCQFRGASYAGVICPKDLPIGTIKAGLQEAINQNTMLRWQPAENAAPTSKPPKGQGPDKSGKRGGKPPKGGGSGGNNRRQITA